MSFANLSALVAVGGVAILAGLLYFLQRLRVRHREQTVVTTLFWREAVEETRARVWVRRFRHPWAYLLILLIGSLIWLSLAEPIVNVADDQEFVVLLDGSAVMARSDLFEQAKNKVAELCRQLPERQRVVVLSQASTTTLLDKSENAEMLQQRLTDVHPEATTSQVEQHLRDILGRMPVANKKATFLVVSTAAPSKDFTNDFNSLDGATVHFVPVTDSVKDPNVGITSLGIAPAMSGQWDRVDLLLEVVGGEGKPTLEVKLDDKPLTAAATEKTSKGFRFRFTNVKAAGGRLVARLPNDSFDLDNEAHHGASQPIADPSGDCSDCCRNHCRPFSTTVCKRHRIATRQQQSRSGHPQ